MILPMGKGARKKKLALALPPPTGQRNKGIYTFFLYINIYIFLKPAISDTENGTKKIQKCHQKKKYVQWKLENWKSEKLNVPE